MRKEWAVIPLLLILYSILLVIATAGIPSALSKMVAEKNAIGRPHEAQRIYRAAIWFAVVAGVGMTVLLYVFAPIYAENISHGGPDATLATRAIAPAMLFFPLIAIMRGYFQGRQHMMPNGISQVVEQIFRLITSIALAYFLLNISLGLGCRWRFLWRCCRRRCRTCSDAVLCEEAQAKMMRNHANRSELYHKPRQSRSEPH